MAGLNGGAGPEDVPAAPRRREQRTLFKAHKWAVGAEGRAGRSPDVICRAKSTEDIMPPTKPFLASTMGGFVLRAGASTRPQNRGKGADTLALKYGSHCLPWGVSHATPDVPPKDTQPTKKHPARLGGCPGGRLCCQRTGTGVGPRLTNCPHDWCNSSNK